MRETEGGLLTTIELTPDPHLLESMRAVGYSFETAVADIFDNSISARATTIHLLTSSTGDPRVSVFDDGLGMDRATALEAMKLAARSPGASREAHDLGRFGLGLKTASLSQCRRLTVASKQAGVTVAFRWDLDQVLSSKRWLLEELDASEMDGLFGWHLLAEVESGTLVCWDDLDLLALTEGGSQGDFDKAVARVKTHCELVFHRFTSGIDVDKVEFTVNGSPFESLDPFLRKNRATQRHHENLTVAGTRMPIHAYTLPFLNKMTASDKKKALAPGSFRDSQGFYIYRGGRLVVWGTWFRLNPKSESGKLARVQVDVPNSLDHLWALDIKKSSATPPRELREALRQFAGQFVTPSAKVHHFRGRKPKEADPITRAWEVLLDRDSFRYEVNREHPMLQQFASTLTGEQLTNLEGVLVMLERTFPILDAHNRLSQDSTPAAPAGELEALVERALGLRAMFAATFETEDEYMEFLMGMEPFCSVDNFATAYRVAAAGA